MKALVPALGLIIGLSCTAVVAEELGSAVSTDDICAVRPDLCGGASMRHKKRKKKPTQGMQPSREMDFSDFDDGSKTKPPEAKTSSTRSPSSESAPKTRKSDESLDAFWDREVENKKSNREVPLLDVEREQVFRRNQPKPLVLNKPAPRYQISFEDYLNENSRVLSTVRSARQDAFQQPVRQAILTNPVPGTNPISVGGAPAGSPDPSNSQREPAQQAAPSGNPPQQ